MACGYHQKNSTPEIGESPLEAAERECLHACKRCEVTKIQCRDDYCNTCKTILENEEKREQCMAPYCYSKVLPNSMYCAGHTKDCDGMEKVRVVVDVKINGIDFPAGEYNAVYGIDTVKIYKDGERSVILEIAGGMDTNFYNEFVELIDK